jgi:hypothetical protein
VASKQTQFVRHQSGLVERACPYSSMAFPSTLVPHQSSLLSADVSRPVAILGMSADSVLLGYYSTQHSL